MDTDHIWDEIHNGGRFDVRLVSGPTQTMRVRRAFYDGDGYIMMIELDNGIKINGRNIIWIKRVNDTNQENN